MPATSKHLSSLSGFLDSDEAQSDVEMMPTPDSNQENRVGAKGKNPTTKAKRGRPISKRLSGGKASTAKTKAVSKKRAPLKDQTNEQDRSDTEEVDEFMDAVDETDHLTQKSEQDEKVKTQQTKASIKKGRPPKKTAPAAVTEQSKQTERDGEFEYTPTTARTSKKGATGRAGTAKPSKQEFAMKPSQHEAEPEDDDTMLSIEQDDIIPHSTYKPTTHIRSSSRQPPTYTASTFHRRAGSASDTERQGTDSNLRKRLGDMTRKFESVELKYRNLRDIGIKEAEANFERLRKQSEERTRAANDLISSLRTELAIQKDINKEALSHASDLSVSKASITAAEARISELTTALTQAHNDNRNLQAKLTASRAASTNLESSSKVPGSAVKGRTPAAKTVMVGSAEAVSNAQIAQLKEDLYSDLTGLILRGVARSEHEDVYDCIQTGRNGTLHFKLSIINDDNTSYEETEFSYIPKLDHNRDRDLIEIMPDYLTEEITFSRVNAGKFYSRVVDTLTRKIVDVD